MASDNRSADRNEIDSMTREFLAKGGKIVQCPPGSSDSVVYKRTSFRRRGAPAAGKDEAVGAPAAPNGEAPTVEASSGDASNGGASGGDAANNG